ncbi:hypothetical protein V5069_08140 [Citrobacter freundii]|uniref:hypothetical protein n=1 Tax=Citrobacter freundii TaxID=546 RepID=UPI0030768640
MPHMTFSGLVEADIHEIWSTLSAFGYIADWHPEIEASRIDNGLPEITPGANRYLDNQMMTSYSSLRAFLLQGPVTIQMR